MDASVQGLTRALPGETCESGGIGWEGQRRRIEPAHGDGVIAGTGFGARVDEASREPYTDSRLIRVVTVHRHLHHVAYFDHDTSFLERLARRRGSNVLAPLDIATGQAPQARTKMAGPTLYEEHPSRWVFDHHSCPHAHVGDELDPTGCAGGTW